MGLDEKRKLGHDPDNDIVMRFVNGQKEAFEELVTRHKDSLYGYVLRQVVDKTVAEDVMQEVYLKALRTLKETKPSNPSAWLIGIARNCCKEWFRERRRFHPGSSLDEQSVVSVNDLEKLDESVSLKKALLKISQDAREILLMKHQKGMTFNEIAKAMNKPIGTVMSIAARAYKKLRSLLHEV